MSTYTIIEELIRDYPERCQTMDDLYIAFCECYDEDVREYTVADFLELKQELHIPSYDTISRIRRQVFHNHPEYRKNFLCLLQK